MANINEKKRTRANWLKNFSAPAAFMLAVAIISLTAFCRLPARTDASPIRNVRNGVSSYAASVVSDDVASEDERVAQ
jgi:hypothetical protein